MYVLDAPTKSLEIVLGEAQVTNPIAVTVSYQDSGPMLGSTDAASNGTTVVTVMAPPPASIVRWAMTATLYNADSVQHIVTVQLNNNGMRRKMQRLLLLPNEYAIGNNSGWQAFDAMGKKR